MRFIFPIEEKNKQPLNAQVERIAWCFDTLFVHGILEVISGEDEIWLLESGIRNQLRRFESMD